MFEKEAENANHCNLLTTEQHLAGAVSIAIESIADAVLTTGERGGRRMVNKSYR